MSLTAEGTATEAGPTATGESQQPRGNTVALLKSFIQASVNLRKERFTSWKESVNYRVQKPFGGMGATETTQDRVAVPEDWSRTKQKTSQLMFKLPKILAKACRPEFKSKERAVTSLVNSKLRKEVKAYYMVDECLADVINAAGVMVSVIGIDQRTRTLKVPRPVPAQQALPLEAQAQEAAALEPGAEALVVEAQSMTPAEPTFDEIAQIISKRFYWTRISPAAFLWPTDFTGSNWDEAPWLGYETWMHVEEAKKIWGQKFPANFKPTDTKPLLLSEDLATEGRTTPSNDQYVKLQIIWYKAAVYDADAFHPDHLRKVVFADGVDQPLEQGDSTWQKFVEATDPVAPIPATPAGVDPATGAATPATPEQPGKPGTTAHYIGLTKFPIRVETLTYVSDMAIPPSDSEAGRPQVREMIRSRSQMLRQRDQSLPIRWYDTNRLDETIADAIRNGDWQDMIPTNGPGDRVVGEVARAQFPRENFEFQRVINGDLDRSWSLSNNALGQLNSGERSATEINAVQDAGLVRLDYEKDRINRYIAEGASVLFSLMQLFMDGTDYVEVVGDAGAKELTAMTRGDIAGAVYDFEFQPDTSDRISLETKQGNTLKVFNLLGNSPTVNRSALETEIMQLHGMDPAELVVKPVEKGPEPPNISYRFSGEDLLNPFVIALVQKTQKITAEEIGAAAMLIQDSIKQSQLAQAKLNPAMVGMDAAAGQPMQPGAAPTPAQQPVTPPAGDLGQAPILKRAEDGTHLT